MDTGHPLRVTDGDVRFYERNGYFCYHHPLFPQAKFDRLKAFFEAAVANLPPGARTEAMDVPHFAYPALFEWLLAEEALDFVETFLGPNIALWSSHFISKPPIDGQSVPWHEDSAYWGKRLDPMEVLTVWLAIDDSTVENGCMRVIPGTHRHGYSEYEPVDRETHVFGTRVKADQFDASTAVDLELKAGECHIHHAKAIHGSNANRSGTRRCGYTMRYMPSSVKMNSDGWNHAIYLARGKDLAGNQYGDPTKRHEAGIREIFRQG